MSDSIGRALVDIGPESAEILYLASVNGDHAAVQNRFLAAGWPVATVFDCDAAVELVAGSRFTVCIVDLTDDVTAFAAIRRLRRATPRLPIVALVDPSRSLTAIDALGAGTTDLLPWPFKERDVASLIADARERVKPESADAPVTNHGALVVSSAAMRVLHDLLRGAADSSASVLIVGEPGTGRSLVARHLHVAGARADRPIVVVDCAGTSPADLERRLFGSSTSRRQPGGRHDGPEAVSPKSAVVEARGGTLLLHNVIEMPARVQARLARILRDREAVATDDGEVLDLEVRAVTITDMSIDGAVADGRIRRDLFERLSQVRIDVPPFRRRREDLPALAALLTEDICRTRGVPPKGFTRSALALLQALPWRGNANEMRSLLDAVTGVVPRAVIELEDVLDHARLDGGGAHLENGITLRDAKARFERDCISAVLVRHQGRVGEAAKALGIQRTNLYRKVRQLKVARSLLSAKK